LPYIYRTDRSELKKALNIIFLSIFMLKIPAQTGGNNIYQFLNLTHSGLVASLGGFNVSLPGKNPNMAYHNPSLLNSEMDKSISLNYVNYFAGINYGQAMYSKNLPKTGSFAFGLTYLNYGSFTEADATGLVTGSFNASEYAFSFIYALNIDSMFSVGINVKPVLSHLEKYTSFGFAGDIGASWRSDDNLISAGIVLRNIGCQITSYAGEDRNYTPFEIQAGASARLAHAPFRFSLTMRHLEKYDLTYEYTGSDQSGNEKSSSQFFENMMRHLVIGTELIPHKNFYVSAGYNYQRRRELQTESKIAAVGFSWGFGINTSLLSIEFGRASYHLAGSSNHISLIARPDLLYKKVSRRN
jgi:hypothetical protein